MRWSEVPLRLRLAAAYALSAAAVLATLGWFLHARLAAELLAGVDDELRSRVAVLAASAVRGDPQVDTAGRVVDPDEVFAQVVDRRGAVRESSSGVAARPLLTARAAAAVRGPTFSTARVAGVDDPARLLAVPVATPGGPEVAVVGANLGDRAEALARLDLLLWFGVPAAVAVASVCGWLVAGAGLRPVERLRREAMALADRGPGGGAGGRVTVPRSRDELAALGRSLNVLLEQQQLALAREYRFLDEASHELRTPLAILKGGLDLAARRPRSPAELEAVVRTAAEETDRLVYLAEDLLVLARSRTGTVPVDAAPVNLRDLLEDTAQRFVAAGRARTARISVDADEVVARLDAMRVRQVVHNLVDNAVRHSGCGLVDIIGRTDGGTVTVSVEDDGRGPAAPGGQGCPEGVGLQVVRAVAAAHGGAVSISRGRSGGTRVDVVLGPPPASAAEPERAPSRAQGRR